MEAKIAFCGWELTDPQLALLGKIATKLQKMSPLIEEVHCTDIKALEAPEADVYVAFGDIAFNSISGMKEVWRAPSVSLMETADARRYKLRVNEILTEIVESLKRGEDIAQTKAHVETKDGVTVGLDANIKVTTEEAEYLRTIKELVGGGTIVIKKGDTEIRIEDKDEQKTTTDNRQ